MPAVRNKVLGKNKYYHNDISISADKSSWIIKIPPPIHLHEVGNSY